MQHMKGAHEVLKGAMTQQEKEAERAVLAKWETELKSRLTKGSADIAISEGQTILNVTLRDNGPYIRVVSGEVGRRSKTPFAVYRYPEGTKAAWYADEKPRPTSWETKEGIDTMFSDLIEMREYFNQEHFGSPKL